MPVFPVAIVIPFHWFVSSERWIYAPKQVLTIKYKRIEAEPGNMSSERPYLESVEIELMTDDPPDESAVGKLIDHSREGDF